MLNHNEAFKRCRDLTLTWRQGDSVSYAIVTYAIRESLGLRELAIRNYPARRDPLIRLLYKSQDALEESRLRIPWRW